MFQRSPQYGPDGIEMTTLTHKQKPKAALPKEESKKTSPLSPYEIKLKYLRSSKKGRLCLSVIGFVKAGRFPEIVDYYFKHRNKPEGAKLLKVMMDPALLRFWYMVLTQENGLKISTFSNPFAPWPGVHPFLQLTGEFLSFLGSISSGMVTQLCDLLHEPSTDKSLKLIALLKRHQTRFYLRHIQANKPEDITEEFYKEIKKVYHQHVYLVREYFSRAEPWCFNARVGYLSAKISELGTFIDRQILVSAEHIAELIDYGKKMVIQHPFSGSYFTFAMLLNEISGYYSKFSAIALVEHLDLTRSNAPEARIPEHKSTKHLAVGTIIDLKRDDLILDAVYAYGKASLFYHRDFSDLQKCLAISHKGNLRDSLVATKHSMSDKTNASAIEVEYKEYKAIVIGFIAESTINTVYNQATLTSPHFRR